MPLPSAAPAAWLRRPLCPPPKTVTRTATYANLRRTLVRKVPTKKRASRGLKPRSNVEPSRVALAALERIRTVLVSSGHEGRVGAPLSMKELAAQAAFLGVELPQSYVSAMREVSRIGDPEAFLGAEEMARESNRLVAETGEEARRYAPFCRVGDKLVCFDKSGARRTITQARHQSELPIVEWQAGHATPVAAHFGEWLDSVADAREEKVENAAKMPQRLKRLLYELGFRFEYPVVGRLETGDVEAVDVLIGRELARQVRGEVDRLFDSSGKASLTLNVDEFTLAASLRTGIYVFEAQDVFRWLRYFRDENFFNDTAVHQPTHPDQVRDLRRAPREPPLVMRGVMELVTLPSEKYVFRAASGAGGNDFYLLGRTSSTGDRAKSAVVHVVDGGVATCHEVEEPLHDLHVGRDGALWGLTTTHAVRVSGGKVRSFPLERPTPGRAWWYGIGAVGTAVVVWGAGGLLKLEGDAFVPFRPDAQLDESESVIALSSTGPKLQMLVCGDRMGAVARFDGKHWGTITEDQVIDGHLADLDVWRGAALVLDRDGTLWRMDKGPPRAQPLPTRHQAFLTEAGTLRSLTGVREYDGGLALSSNGGVLVVGAEDPIFYAAAGSRDPMRLARVGAAPAGGTEPNDDVGLVVTGGGHAWVLRDGQVSVVDLRDL